jgi:glycosyltransferase involved in cell wall biosynthesis
VYIKKKLINLVERYSLNKKDKFINHCKEMPLAYSLAGCQLFQPLLNPRLLEGVAVEAQSMGKPIIASNIGVQKKLFLTKNLDFYISLMTQENLRKV